LPIVIEEKLQETLIPPKDFHIFGEFRKMPSFCKTHFIFYSQPRCPKCLAAEASLQGYAGLPALQGRWGQLRANPDILNQDKFGVCGTTSIVYLLLWYEFARARELYKAALADIDPNFTGSAFTSAGHQVIAVKFKYLSGRYRLREQYAPPVPNPAGLGLVAAKAVSTPLFLDYLISRALGYVFKKVAKNRYDGEKMDFNMEFDPQNLGDYRNFTHYGSFALRTNNLAFILQEIVGAQNVHIVHKQGGPVRPVPLAQAVAGVATTNVTTVAQLQLEFNNRLAVLKSFAIAGIYADIVRNGQIVVSSPTAAAGGTRVPYNHWIVINNFTPVACGAGGAGGCLGDVALDIWTWGQNYNARICQNHLLSYIEDVVFGHF
jgi:hypothetical protein